MEAIKRLFKNRMYLYIVLALVAGFAAWAGWTMYTRRKDRENWLGWLREEKKKKDKKQKHADWVDVIETQAAEKGLTFEAWLVRTAYWLYPVNPFRKKGTGQA